MRLIRFVLVSSTLGLTAACEAQFERTFTSRPDSAIVIMNDQVVGHTPCRIEYNWPTAAKAGRIIFQVSRTGFGSWADTVFTKPSQLDELEHVILERTLPDLSTDSLGKIADFDRMISDLRPESIIGQKTDKAGATSPLKWSASIGVLHQGGTFRHAMMKMGLGNEPMTKEELFSGPANARPIPPRFLVGAKLIDYDVDIRYSGQDDHGAGPFVSRTSMNLEWQVFDREVNAVVLTYTNRGEYRTRSKEKYASEQPTLAFEDALAGFLDQGEFVSMLRSTLDKVGLVRKGATDTLRFMIKRPLAFGTLPLGQMLQKAERACVTLITDIGHGSGTMVSSDGLVLTAYHVVENVNRVEVQFADGVRHKAELRAYDLKHDVALLSIDGSGYKALQMSMVDSMGIGDDVVTIGAPADVALGQSVSKGIVSGRRSLDGVTYLQTDMAVSPGNSGGPLLNEHGVIVGVVQSKIVQDGVEGIGFALPVSRAIEVLGIQIVE